MAPVPSIQRLDCRICPVRKTCSPASPAPVGRRWSGQNVDIPSSIRPSFRWRVFRKTLTMNCLYAVRLERSSQEAGSTRRVQTSRSPSPQPPVLTGTGLSGAAAFAAAPIQSITYGISPANSVPVAGTPISTEVTVPNSVSCPTSNPVGGDPAVFTPPVQAVPVGDGDGNYLLHYYAQDCAGTQELSFTQDGAGSWSTSFYTVPINVDTIAPVVASGPTLSPSTGSYSSANPLRPPTAARISAPVSSAAAPPRSHHRRPC